MARYLVNLDDGRRLDLPAGRMVHLGRGAECEIRIDDTFVSRVHCVAFAPEGTETVLVRDRGSRNGTLVNGERLDREKILQPGDELRLGSSRYRFAIEASVRRPASEPEGRHEPDARNESLAETAGPSATEIPPPPWWMKAKKAAETFPFPSHTQAPPQQNPPGPPSPPEQPAVHPAGHEAQEPQPDSAPKSNEQTQAKPQPELDSDAELEPDPDFEPERRREPEAPQTGQRKRRGRSAGRSGKQRPDSSAAIEVGRWIAKLAQMERQASRVEQPKPSSRQDSPTPSSETAKRDVPLGGVARPIAGRRWDATREALDYLTIAGVVGAGLVTVIFGVILSRALLRLAQDGLSVFIPFGYGGRQFSQLELVHIGIALALTAATPLVLVQLVLKWAEEFLAVLLGGLAVGLGIALIYGSGAVSGTALLNVALFLLLLNVLAVAGFSAWSVAVPLSRGRKLLPVGAAVLLAASALCLVRTLAAGMPEPEPFDVPVAMPAVPGSLVLAGLSAAAGLLAFGFLLRAIVSIYGDEPTQATLTGHLSLHGATSLLVLVLILSNNAGEFSGWGSGFAALLTLTLVVFDCFAFVQAVRFVRFTIQ